MTVEPLFSVDSHQNAPLVVLDGRPIQFFPDEKIAAEDVARFVLDFVAAWQIVPEPVRGALWNYWRPEENNALHPRIFLVPGFPYPLNVDGFPVHALCDDLGTQLVFSSFSMTRLLDRDKFRSTVLHELAHAYRWACRTRLKDDYDGEEREVDAQVEIWLRRKEIR